MAPFQPLSYGQGASWRFRDFVQRAVEETQDPADVEEIKENIRNNFHPRNADEGYSIGEVKIWLVLNTPDEILQLQMTDGGYPYECLLHFSCDGIEYNCYLKVYRTLHVLSNYYKIVDGEGSGDKSL